MTDALAAVAFMPLLKQVLSAYVEYMRMASSRKKSLTFDYRLLIDIVIRIFLALFFAFTAGIYCKNAGAQLHGIDMDHINAANIAMGLSIFAGGLYTLLIACLYVLRLRPVNKFAGLGPAIAALLGGFLMFGIVWFKPRTDLPVSVEFLASFLILNGNIFAAYVLSRLGRSFSILPESRKLVTAGPYKIIRHPLYLAEALATFGVMILFLSVGAVTLAVAQTLLQFVRIHYEEKTLSKNFPEYKAYAKKTARLVPGVY